MKRWLIDEQAELGVPHSKYKLGGPNQIVVLDKCHCDSVHLLQIVNYVYIQCMVNIWLGKGSKIKLIIFAELAAKT